MWLIFACELSILTCLLWLAVFVQCQLRHWGSDPNPYLRHLWDSCKSAEFSREVGVATESSYTMRFEIADRRILKA